MIRRETLVDQVYIILCDHIRKMEPGENKLPSEESLAEKFNVSRPTVRDALKRLLKDGYITTIHGLGTFGFPAMFNVEGRTDLSTDFFQLIKGQHKDASIQNEHLGIQKSSNNFCKIFNCLSQDVYRMVWTYSVSGLPAIICEYEFLLSEIRKIPQAKDQYQDLAEFSEECLHNRLAYCVMNLAAVDDNTMTKRLGVKENTALLNIQEIIHDIGDHPVGYANCFIHPNNIQLTMTAQFG